MKEINTYEIIYGCSRRRSSFISIYFFLLRAMKIADILPRRTRVNDKNTRSSVSQSKYVKNVKKYIINNKKKPTNITVLSTFSLPW